MNATILLLGLLVGVPDASYASSARASRPAGLSLGDARLLARFKEDSSRFSPHFGRSDPAAHGARFSGAGGSSGAASLPAARDKALEAALFRPRAVTSLQMSWPLK